MGRHKWAAAGKYLLFFWGTALGLSLVAQGREISLEEIQARALEQSALLKAESQETQSELFAYRNEGLLQNPRLTFEGGRSRDGDSTGGLFALALVQDIPFPGKLGAQQRVAEYQALLRRVNEEEARLVVQHEATISAARLAMYLEIAKHTFERKRRLRLVEGFIKSRPQASPIQKVEAIRIEIQIRLVEKSILELEQARQLAGSDLNFFLRFSEPVRPKLTWLRAPHSLDRQSLETELFFRNQEWKRKLLEVGRAEAQVDRASRDRWPDFSVGFLYRGENSLPIYRTLGGLIGVTIPIFDRGQYSIPAAQVRLDAEIWRKEQLDRDLRRRLEQSLVQLESSAKILQEFPPQLVAHLETSFDLAEREFRKGRVNVSDFLQADGQIHETLDSIYRAQVTYLENLSRTLLLAGLPPKWK